MGETKLKPCPFCGGKAHKRIVFPVDADGMEMNMYIVGCETCDISFSFLWDEECAIELWNTRKPIDDTGSSHKEGQAIETILRKYVCKDCSDKCICLEKNNFLECNYYNEHYDWVENVLAKGSSPEEVADE